MSILQRIFRRPDYQSEITLFIEQLKTEKPDLEAMISDAWTWIRNHPDGYEE